MKAYPKIFAIGTDYIKDIFKNDVEVTEKVDGSQFAFGIINDHLFFRSKGAVIYAENPEKMFIAGVEYIFSIQDKLSPNIIYYAEYLKRPRHNTLTYLNTPKNHLTLFGVMDLTEKFISNYEHLSNIAATLDIDVVPLIYKGNIKDADFLLGLLERESYLGGAQIEGLVVKNYQQKFLLGGQPMPLMAGKFVSEKFKEVHRKEWRKEHTGKGKWDVFKESFKTEARWLKGIQHLRDSGNLEKSPCDIGNLLKVIKDDIVEEEKETIKEFLWKEFNQEVLRAATSGFPEWYKEFLLRNSMED